VHVQGKNKNERRAAIAAANVVVEGGGEEKKPTSSISLQPLLEGDCASLLLMMRKLMLVSDMLAEISSIPSTHPAISRTGAPNSTKSRCPAKSPQTTTTTQKKEKKNQQQQEGAVKDSYICYNKLELLPPAAFSVQLFFPPTPHSPQLTQILYTKFRTQSSAFWQRNKNPP
jgi:hypothetical protein